MVKRKLKRNLCECGCGQACNNRFVGGHNSRGTKHSEETKQKMSRSHKGQTAWNKGRVGISNETREKIAKASRERKWSDESRRKISISKMRSNNPMYGKTHTEEAKVKISEASSKRRHSEETKIKIAISEMRCRTDGYCNAWGDEEYKADLRKDFCSNCGMTNEDHIKKWNRILGLHHKDGDKKNCCPGNFDTLCVRCHAYADWELRHREEEQCLY